MQPHVARLARILTVFLVATFLASAHAADASAERTQTSLSSSRSRSVSDGVAATLARDSSLDSIDTHSSLRTAPRVAVRGELRLCGGEPLPPSLFTSETICLEQKLTGVTARHVRERSLDATAANVTFAGRQVDAKYVGFPRLVVPGAEEESVGRGLFDWGLLGTTFGTTFGTVDAETEEQIAMTEAHDDADVFVRFPLDVSGVFFPALDGQRSEGAPSTDETSQKRSGTLESVVAIQPSGRYYYEIVWFELSITVPTFYSGAVQTIVEEGEKLNKPQEDIDDEIENLVTHEAIFFPCTNFIARPFCEEGGLSA